MEIWYKKSEVSPINASRVIVVTNRDKTYEAYYYYYTGMYVWETSTIFEYGESILFWRYKKTVGDTSDKNITEDKIYSSKLNNQNYAS